MVHEKRRLKPGSIGAVLGLLLFSAEASGAPLVAQVGRCVPTAAGDSTGGIGNTPGPLGSRKLKIQFGYAVSTQNEDKAAAIQATDRVQVCWIDMSGFHCPWLESSEAAWLAYDETAGPSGPNDLGAPDLDWVKNAGGKGAHQEVANIPMDWGDASSEGKFLFLLVNGPDEAADLTSSAVNDALSTGGFCPVPYPLVEGNQFRVYGVRDAVQNPFSTLDPCADGEKSGSFPKTICIQTDVEDFALSLLDGDNNLGGLERWQRDVVMGGLPTQLSPPTWKNGNSSTQCGGPCKTHVHFIASGGRGEGKLGLFTVGAPTLTMTSTGQVNRLRKRAGELFGLLSHEYFHSLQGAWNRELNDAPQVYAHPFFEGGPNSIGGYACLTDYDPLLPSDLCVSGRRINGGDPAYTNAYLDVPSLNPMPVPYMGEVFWRYAIDSFASPRNPDNPAHPGGETSVTPANGNFEHGEAERRPDEGADLLGWVLQAYSENPNEEIYNATDAAMRTALGRSLDAMILDMHTAYVLKDYTAADRRFGLEWVGNFNEGATQMYSQEFKDALPPTNTVAQEKAQHAGRLPVPADLVGLGVDNLRRARRVLDSHEAGVNGATPITLLPNEFKTSTSDVKLEPFSAAYLSVIPDQLFTSLDPAEASLVVRLYPTKGMPRFRIFTIDSSGQPSFVGECDDDPDESKIDQTQQCPITEVPYKDGDGNTQKKSAVSQLVGVTADVQEVIVVASAAREPVNFTWSFGTVVPHVAIIDPLKSHPAQVGHPDSPTGTRPMLVQFRVLDEALEPIGFNTDDLVIRIPGCNEPVPPPPGPGDPPPPPPCELKAADGDFTVTPFQDGVYWAIVTLPGAYYPQAPVNTDLDLEIVLPEGITGIAPAAVHVDSAPLQMATELVLDTSGSMNDFGGSKLAAAKIASTLLIQAMGDSDSVGIVGFAEDARVIFGHAPVGFPSVRAAALQAVAGIQAVGCTSIGDGLYEGQSELAATFDLGNNPVFQGNYVHSMVVLSDGLTNSEFLPTHYYVKSSGTPTADGTNNDPGCDPDPDPSDNAPWHSDTPLRYPDRVAYTPPTGQPTIHAPTVSAIHIGPEDGGGALQNLVFGTGARGSFTSFDGPPDGTQTKAMKATIDLSDAMRQAADIAGGYERVHTYQPVSVWPAYMPSLAVEAGALELLVSVSSSRDSTDVLRLVSPSGATVDPFQASSNATVFRVPNPERGMWTWGLSSPTIPPPPSVDDPAVFVEHAVRSPLVLFAAADVVAPLPVEAAFGSYESGRFVGSDVRIRAVPVGLMPIQSAAVTAEVVLPSGSVVNVTLLDDGASADGKEGDGVYGAVFRQTSSAGVYPVLIVASGVSDVTGGYFRRERSLAFELHDAHDDDTDGLPDWWENRHGTEPATPDGTADPDSDGLINREEWNARTAPLRSDTDGGGESDGSEVAAGRDPTDPRDDVLRVTQPTVLPGNGKVMIDTYVRVGPAHMVQVERATTPEGPFVPITPAPNPDGVLVDSASNDAQVCYRVRAVSTSAEGGWSWPECTVPRTDPFAPTFKLALDTGGGTSYSTLVRVRIEATDEPWALVLPPSLIDRDIRPSDVAEMLVSTRADFLGATWQPFSPEVVVTLPNTERAPVYVKLRDGAGNESEAGILLVRLLPSP